MTQDSELHPRSPQNGQYVAKHNSAPLAGLAVETSFADIKEPDSYGWDPQNPSVTTARIEGELANRVRQRFGCGSPVFITETNYWGGYSEYTQENEHDFEVTCGEHSVTFERSEYETVIGQSLGGSLYRRFGMWLDATKPETFDEWFEPEETCEWWESYLVKEKTLARHLGASEHFGQTAKLYLRAADYRRSTRLAGGTHSPLPKIADAENLRWDIDILDKPREDGFVAIQRSTTLLTFPRAELDRTKATAAASQALTHDRRW